jgi:hypothetical protein
MAVKSHSMAASRTSAGVRREVLGETRDDDDEVSRAARFLGQGDARSGSERRSAVEAIGRFIDQSPGYRQGTILEAWQFLPCRGAVSALGHFGTKT